MMSVKSVLSADWPSHVFNQDQAAKWKLYKKMKDEQSTTGGQFSSYAVCWYPAKNHQQFNRRNHSCRYAAAGLKALFSE